MVSYYAYQLFGIYCCILGSSAQEFFFWQPSYTATEGEGSFIIQIERTQWNNEASVDVRFVSSEAPIDPAWVHVTDNTYTRTFQFPVNKAFWDIQYENFDDDIRTPGFSAELTLSNPSPGTIGVYSATTVTIIDNDPAWTSWGEWSVECSAAACGISGTQTRTRTCNDPVTNDANICNGSPNEQRSCQTPCAEWATWGVWSECSVVSCTDRTQTRTRICINHQPSDADTCNGSPNEQRSCEIPCANWDEWSQWNTCSVTCGTGTQTRQRPCIDSVPTIDDETCSVPSEMQNQECNTGILCNVYCSSETKDTEYGPITAPAGQTSGYVFVSEQLCQENTQQANSPIARATCRDSNGVGYWDWNTLLDCGEITTPEEMLENLKTTTDEAAEVDAEDVSRVADVLEYIVALRIPDRPVTDQMVDIVNNLLDVNVETLIEARILDGSPSRIVNSFEKQLQIVDLQELLPYRRMTPNAAVEVFMASQDVLNQGIYAASDSSSSNTLLTLERGSSGSADVTIEIPPEIGEQFPEGTRVAVNVLKNHKLLTSGRLANENKELKENRGTNSRVISATVGNQKISGLGNPVTMMFSPIQTKANNTSTECVFWAFDDEDWLTEGCTYRGLTNDSKIICECTHLTNFAVLMDIYGGSKITPTQDFILEILTYVGCCLSILGLLVTLITYCSSKKLMSKRPNQILMSLTTALLGLYIVFIIALSIDTGRNHTELEVIGCSILAGVLQYFTLASLFWMAVEGFNMYLMFIKVINSYIPHLLRKASLFAWGLPVLIVVITAGISRDNYARSDFCFLEKWPLVGGVLVPIAIIILINVIIYIFVLLKLSRDSPGMSKLQKKRKSLKWRRWRNAVCIMTLMGLSWAVGYLSVIKAASFFSQLIFCLLNAMQGYAIFMLYCVQQADVRNTWKRWCGTIRQDYLITSSSRGNNFQSH